LQGIYDAYTHTDADMNKHKGFRIKNIPRSYNCKRMRSKRKKKITKFSGLDTSAIYNATKRESSFSALIARESYSHCGTFFFENRASVEWTVGNVLGVFVSCVDVWVFHAYFYRNIITHKTPGQSFSFVDNKLKFLWRYFYTQNYIKIELKVAVIILDIVRIYVMNV
jgi:hypothetical protein